MSVPYCTAYPDSVHPLNRLPMSTCAMARSCACLLLESSLHLASKAACTACCVSPCCPWNAEDVCSCCWCPSPASGSACSASTQSLPGHGYHLLLLVAPLLCCRWATCCNLASRAACCCLRAWRSRRRHSWRPSRSSRRHQVSQNHWPKLYTIIISS